MRSIGVSCVIVTTVIVLAAASVEPKGAEPPGGSSVPAFPPQSVPGSAHVRSDRSGYIQVGWYTFGESSLGSLSIQGSEIAGSEDGTYHHSEIEITEGVSEWGPVGRYGYRVLTCTVPRGALQFSPERYRILATVLDAASPLCTTYGQLSEWDSNGNSTSPWVFEGELPVQALLSAPEQSVRQTGTDTQTDYVRGVTSHWQCTKHGAWAFREGGFSVGDNVHDLVVTPGGAPWSRGGNSNCKAIDK